MHEYIDIHTHKFHSGILIYNLTDHFIPEYNCLYSMGIHPMNTAELAWNTLSEMIKSGHLAAIGEAGLDRNSSTDITTQTVLFRQEIALSEQYALPMIIHCVRAYPELLHLRDKSHAKQPWIVHGFNNNQQIMNELLKHGLYISAGAQIFNPNANIRKWIPSIPLDRLFLETDDSSFSIEDIYREVAILRQKSEQIIKNQIFINFKQIFQK